MDYYCKKKMITFTFVKINNKKTKKERKRENSLCGLDFYFIICHYY